MARIQTYDNDNFISDADKLVGTEGVEGENLNKTKNFTLGAIKQYVRSGGENYNVFTALLTQDTIGGFILNNNSEEPVLFIIGVTYFIEENVGNADFTNIGAPNNNVGTYFIATGTTPNSWGDGGYVNLTYNEGAPTVIVLENTIGNIWFTYDNVGRYSINSTNLFTNGKTFLPNGSSSSSSFTLFNQRINSDGTGLYASYGYSIQNIDTNTIKINSLVDIEVFGDDVLNNNFPIEIRVYN